MGALKGSGVPLYFYGIVTRESGMATRVFLLVLFKLNDRKDIWFFIKGVPMKIFSLFMFFLIAIPCLLDLQTEESSKSKMEQSVSEDDKALREFVTNIENAKVALKSISEKLSEYVKALNLLKNFWRSIPANENTSLSESIKDDIHEGITIINDVLKLMRYEAQCSRLYLEYPKIEQDIFEYEERKLVIVSLLIEIKQAILKIKELNKRSPELQKLSEKYGEPIKVFELIQAVVGVNGLILDFMIEKQLIIESEKTSIIPEERKISNDLPWHLISN